MSFKEQPFYAVVCDGKTPDGTPCDVEVDGEYQWWADKGTALDVARDSGWAVKQQGELVMCLDHAYRSVCMDDDCIVVENLIEADDGWMYCKDHKEQGMD